MAEMKYLDFDLLIERSGEHYMARVLNSPAGQATVDFNLPFSEQDIDIFILKIGRPRRGMRHINSPEMEAAKTFGGRLFETIFGGEVLGCFRTSLYDATRKDAGLRVRLRVTNAPDLADLPWEYLYNPTLNRFLSLSVETPIVRYLDLPEPIRPLTIKPPLRVLVMISSPHDYPKLHVEQEWAKLKDAVGDLEREGLVTLERVEKATLSVLQRRLRQKEYHIYHFIGHGGFDKQALDGVLILEDEKERGRPISGQYLGTLLHDHRPLRLAILNACEGARASSSDPFAGTAQSLVQQGIPAVIAMQFEITDEAAITFADELYGALADGYPVDAALAEARKAIYAQGNDIEWGTPVLYMRSPDGRVFDIARMSDEERREAKIAFLIRGAKAAMAREDWQAVKERLQEALALEPAHTEARTILRQLPQEQALASLYAQGQKHYEAGSWSQALDCLHRVQEIRANYKNVNALVTAIDEEIHRNRIAGLLREAKEAVAKEDWRTVIEKYQAVFDLEPTHAEAKAGLSLARHEQELANLYTQGHKHYEAKRWSEALECFHRVQEIRAHYRQVDNLIASTKRTLDEQRQHEKVTVLISEAEKAVANEEWPAAIEKYEAALQLTPNHAEAKAGLSRARQEQELTELYAQGQEHYEAKRWPQALDCLRRVQKIKAHHKQVDHLIAAIERAQDEQSRRARVTVLLREAKAAIAQEDWQTVSERYKAVLELEPNHAEARAGLSHSQQEQELARLYAQGREHYEAKRWPQALIDFHQIQKKRANYKNVEALVAAVNKEMPKKDKARVPVRKLVALAATVVLLAIIILVWLSFRKDRPVPAVEATLSISTNPDEAAVFLDGDSIGITPINNHRIKAGTISLRIEKRHYFPIDSMVVIKVNQDTSFAFSLRPAAWVSIEVNPSDAEVICDEKSVESSRLAGMALSVGPHTISISRQGYRTLKGQFNLAQGDTTLRYSLQAEKTGSILKVAPPTLGEVQIDSEPTEAKIFVDDQIKGTTPSTIRNLPVGSYAIVLRKTGYKDYFTTVTVVGGKVTMVRAMLAPLMGKLRAQVKPSGSIYIYEKSQKASATVPYETSLPIGSYQIRMESPGLGVLEKKVNIEADKLQELSIDFTKTVTLKVTSVDTSGNLLWGEIWLDNQSTGKNTPRELPVRLGQHTVGVRREGFVLVGGERVINLEHDMKVEFVLKK